MTQKKRPSAEIVKNAICAPLFANADMNAVVTTAAASNAPRNHGYSLTILSSAFDVSLGSSA